MDKFPLSFWVKLFADTTYTTITAFGAAKLPAIINKLQMKFIPFGFREYAF